MFKNNCLDPPPPHRDSLLNHSRLMKQLYSFNFSCISAAEVYVGLDKETEAMACVKEANLLFPHSPDVLFQVRSIYMNEMITNTLWP